MSIGSHEAVAWDVHACSNQHRSMRRDAKQECSTKLVRGVVCPQSVRSPIDFIVAPALILSLMGSIPMQACSEWIANCGKLNPHENLRIVPCKVANFQRKSMSKTSRCHQGKRALTTQQASSPHFKTNLHKGFLQSPSPLDVGK